MKTGLKMCLRLLARHKRRHDWNTKTHLLNVAILPKSYQLKTCKHTTMFAVRSGRRLAQLVRIESAQQMRNVAPLHPLKRVLMNQLQITVANRRRLRARPIHHPLLLLSAHIAREKIGGCIVSLGNCGANRRAPQQVLPAMNTQIAQTENTFAVLGDIARKKVRDPEHLVAKDLQIFHAVALVEREVSLARINNTGAVSEHRTDQRHLTCRNLIYPQN